MAKPQTVSVSLSEPITIDGEPVDTITLRRPHAGELRGCKLTELLAMDIIAWEKLLPRITSPVVTAPVLAQIDPEDLTELLSEGVVFFVGDQGHSPTT